ncbi:unnamed protein product [Lactuca saligna]|uniref:Uncharacterized protein n=1 Tax=Lactuca saligna TaxID=75948 RepID=A0AA35YKC3_LACSI|nr:unnamed protein product [Lactuca saligna]
MEGILTPETSVLLIVVGFCGLILTFLNFGGQLLFHFCYRQLDSVVNKIHFYLAIFNRESLNAPGCDAIHITEIEIDIDCDTFIPSINTLEFQPWYSSFPQLENGILHSFTTYIRVKSSGIEAPKVKTMEKGSQSYATRKAMTDDEIVEIVLFPVVNEACHVLEEKIIVKASDLDIASFLGMSFPLISVCS